MPFKGITFAGQNVTPKNDGGLYQAHYGDGILWGCSMAISGDDLVIQSGEFIAGGRVCQVDGATNVDLSTRTLTNGYIQVVMDFDMSKPEGTQWNIHLPLIESATTTFPALTQDDINDTGTLYQLELAVVQISGGNLTNITSRRGASAVMFRPHNGGYTQISGNAGYRSMQFVDDNRVNTCGFVADISNKRTELYVNSGDIYFRPNGQNSGVNTVYINANGFIGGTRYRRITFTGGECYQVGNFCHLNIYRNISSTPSANTWHNLIKPNEIPAPITTTRGLGQLTLDTGNTGGSVNLRVGTDKQIQWALSGTTGSWNIFGTIDYWTNDAS